MEDNIRKEDRLRAAAYCRVSTELEEQEGSFEWQMRHYTELLSGNLDVELVQVYGDEGYSGRYADRRPEFMRMLQDCENGKIDIIYTKSISRFSRNLADCATTIRRPKELGIAVIFEKEGINSMDSQSELLFHILTIIAQEESKSIGMNVKWSIDKRHAEGKPTGKVTYGYRRADSDGQWRSEEEEARRVRYAFEQAAQCASYQSIREGLDEMEKQAGTGISWTRNRNRVPLLLRDVSYTGDYITDRYYTALSENGHRYSRHNRGERDQYYLENHHEGIVIIDRITWEKVQAILKQREENSNQGIYKRSKVHHVFYGMVFCGACGTPFVRRTYCSKKNHYKAWNCKERQKGAQGNGCQNRIIREDELTQLVLEKLGWKEMDEERFRSDVRRVLVYPARIEIE